MMHLLRTLCTLTAVFLFTALPGDLGRAAAGSKVRIGAGGVMEFNGRRAFPIGFTLAPKPGALSPRGVEGLRELRQAGALMFRTGPTGSDTWSDAYLKVEREWLDAAARNEMFALPWLKELSAVPAGATQREEKLRRVIRLFRDHPGLGVWKGEDEPEWGKKPVAPLVRAREIIREEDPGRPVWIVQAPRGTVESLKRYIPAYDIGGIDIYPVSYPPGVHSIERNREISMVGDFARRIREVNGGAGPFWMTLQIAFSGTVKPGKTLRWPTFEQQRFMAYQSIINGARGLIYFGGGLPQTLNRRDTRLGWNWTYWDRVLRPLIEELGDRSPLAPALTSADEPGGVTASLPDPEIEFLTRRSGGQIYLMACRREGKTGLVEFSGLPAVDGEAEVMFEEPRTVQVRGGRLKDWFGPFDVHVYRLKQRN